MKIKQSLIIGRHEFLLGDHVSVTTKVEILFEGN